MTLELRSESEGDTLAVARRLASLLKPGDVILLTGELGSGKTLFTSGIAEGLGVDAQVTSPSFVLTRRYEGFIPMVHADAYRLESIAELDDLGLEEEARGGILVVEWGGAVKQGLTADHLLVEFEVTGPTERHLRFERRGTWQHRSLQGLER